MPSSSAPGHERAALPGTLLRLGRTGFIVLGVHAVAVDQAIGYWRVTRDPARAAVTASLFQRGSRSSGACRARFRYGGRSHLVGPIQGRGGQQVSLLVERAGPTSYRAGKAYGPIIAVFVLGPGALAFWPVYRPGAGIRRRPVDRGGVAPGRRSTMGS